LRIWEVGTKRILGVTAHAQTDDADDPSAPSKLLDALGAGEHLYSEISRSVRLRPNVWAKCKWYVLSEQHKLIIKPYGIRNEALTIGVKSRFALTTVLLRADCRDTEVSWTRPLLLAWSAA